MKLTLATVALSIMNLTSVIGNDYSEVTKVETPLYHLLGKRLSSLREDRNLEEENCCCEDDNGNGTSDDEDGTGDDDEDGTSPSPTLTMTAIPSSEPTAEPTRPRIDVVSDAMFAIFSGFGIDSSVLTATTYCNWDGVTCNGIEPIQMCCYRYNGSYDGTIATDFGLLTEMTQLELDYSYLGGSLPSELGNLEKLKLFNVRRNKGGLGGTVPRSVFELPSMTYLALAEVGFTGSIPGDITMSETLNYMALNSNAFTGTLPEPLFTYTADSSSLFLQDNAFTGSIPTAIGQCDSQYVFLSENQLTGTIPSEIGNMPNLLRFEVSLNDLTGGIPTEVDQLDLSAVTHFEIDGNTGMSGNAPSSLCGIANFVSTDTGISC